MEFAILILAAAAAVLSALALWRVSARGGSQQEMDRLQTALTEQLRLARQEQADAVQNAVRGLGDILIANQRSSSETQGDKIAALDR